MRPLFLSLMLASCAPNPACEAAKAEQPTLVLGAGIQTFEPLSDGDSVVVERGFQGGIHVWGALHATGLAQDLTRRSGLPVVSLRILSESASIGGFTTVPNVFHDIGDGVLEALAVQAIFDSTDPADVTGRTVTLHAEVRDDCGTHVEADVSVQIVAAPDTGL